MYYVCGFFPSQLNNSIGNFSDETKQFLQQIMLTVYMDVICAKIVKTILSYN